MSLTSASQHLVMSLSSPYVSVPDTFFCYRFARDRDLHSFPTRRSSDRRKAHRDRSRDLAAPNGRQPRWPPYGRGSGSRRARGDRKSTRLNSSHRTISYAVFCLKKKIPQVTELVANLPNLASFLRYLTTA